MEPSPPGWYRDPRRPGGRRYWDGHAWVDVDNVVDGPPEPGPAAAGPRLISQRGGEPDQDEAAEAGEPTDSEPQPD